MTIQQRHDRANFISNRILAVIRGDEAPVKRPARTGETGEPNPAMVEWEQNRWQSR
jgi:hypothetical protein